MLVAWRNEAAEETVAATVGTSTVLTLIPKQRTLVDLVGRVAS
jgi:hypothetical protein